jgi:hypothetical protein
LKKILTSAAAVALTTTAFAGNIMPEMTRQGLNDSDNGLGLAWSKRNTAGLKFSSDSYDTEQTAKTGEVETTAMTPFVFFNHDMISVEFDYNDGEVETTPVTGTATKTESTAYDLKSAYRINNMFAATLGYNSTEGKTSTTTTTTSNIELGFSYNHGNGMIAGLGYTLSNAEVEASSITRDVDFNKLTLGVGYQNWNNRDGYSVEVSYDMQSDEKGDVVSGSFASVKKVSNLVFQGTYAMAELQVDGSLTLGTDEGTQTGDLSENKRTVLDLAAEYEFTSNIYGFTGFNMNNEEWTDQDPGVTSVEEEKLNTIKLGAGYRTAMFDASLELNKVSGEDTTTGSTATDKDGMGWAVAFAYNF